MDRRGFLGSILAAAAAPAIVRADSLMRVIPRDTSLLTSTSTITIPANALGADGALFIRTEAFLRNGVVMLVPNGFSLVDAPQDVDGVRVTSFTDKEMRVAQEFRHGGDGKRVRVTYNTCGDGTSHIAYLTS